MSFPDGFPDDSSEERLAHAREVNAEWDADKEEEDPDEYRPDDYPCDPVDVAYERARANGWED